MPLRGTFSEILQGQLIRYPRMEPRDCVKLAYQNALGPAHAALDRDAVHRALLAEWGELSDRGAPCPPEPIGNGLCRFHLAGTGELPLAASLLADLFCLTAGSFRGQRETLEENLETLENLALPGMAAFVAEYRREGCPAVHHSDQYREAYQPHYRVLLTAHGGYFQALLAVARLSARGAPAIVAIDGRCGSGKSGLGDLLGKLFPCNVIHMDDYYLPLDQRDERWESIPGGNMDFARFLREVLTPAGRGEAIHYRPFDCQSGRLKEERILPARPLTVVEGSYSQHPRLTDRYDLKIFLTCDPDRQRCRLTRREGPHFAAYVSRWMPMEERYFRQCGTEEGSGLVVDTTDFF